VGATQEEGSGGGGSVLVEGGGGRFPLLYAGIEDIKSTKYARNVKVFK